MDRFEAKIAQIGRPERLLYSCKSRCCTECFIDITDKRVKSYHLLILDSTEINIKKKAKPLRKKTRFYFHVNVVDCGIWLCECFLNETIDACYYNSRSSQSV